MKKFNFNPNVLTAGVALALGLVSGSANASTATNQSPTQGKIDNIAEATYSVDNVPQPKVTSNAVTVNTSEVANFTLVATSDSKTDDKNEAQVAVPGQATTFTNTLTNEGNLSDTYILNITQNNESTIPTGNQDYQFTSPSVITYVIKNRGGSTPSADQLAPGQAQTGTVPSGSSISLLPGQYAELSYNLTTPSAQIGGKSGVGTLEATSTKIKSGGTLINENQAIVRLPVFAITKTATSTNIDLNAANPSIDYSITVKNDDTATYAADAVGVLIQDKLPVGLSVQNGTAGITVSSTDGSTTNGSAPQILTSGNQQIIAISGVALKAGETMTITFKALVDKATVDKTKPLINNADVYDNYGTTTPTAGDNPTSDIKDSTATSNDSTNTHVPNDPEGTGTGGDISTPITLSDRNLKMITDAPKELAPTGSTTVTHTITNLGNQAEGDVAGELVLTIADGTATNTTVQPAPTTTSTLDDIVVTIKNSLGNAVATKTFPSGTTSIDLNSVSAGGIPVGGTATVTYTEVSTNNYDTTTQNPLVPTDTTTLTLTPTGTAAPAPITNTDTFNVKDMNLVKTQALDANCDGAEVPVDTTAITAKPSECVIYRITATNNFTTQALTNVVISDAASNWSAKATYVAGSGKDSANGTVTPPGTSVTSSTFSIPATGTGWLQFAIKINQ